jgi:hypothetical protein
MAKNIQNNINIYFCFGPISFCAKTTVSPVSWISKEPFPRDSSHCGEADQPTPPTAEVNVPTYTPTLLHG